MDFNEYKNSSYWMQQRNIKDEGKIPETAELTLGGFLFLLAIVTIAPFALAIAAILEA